MRQYLVDRLAMQSWWRVKSVCWWLIMQSLLSSGCVTGQLERWLHRGLRQSCASVADRPWIEDAVEAIGNLR